MNKIYDIPKLVSPEAYYTYASTVSESASLVWAIAVVKIASIFQNKTPNQYFFPKPKAKAGIYCIKTPGNHHVPQRNLAVWGSEIFWGSVPRDWCFHYLLQEAGMCQNEDLSTLDNQNISKQTQSLSGLTHSPKQLSILTINRTVLLFKAVMFYQVSLLIMSAQCLVWSRDLPHSSPLHTDSFGLSCLQIQGSKFGKTNVHGFLFFYMLNFQQFQAT